MRLFQLKRAADLHENMVLELQLKMTRKNDILLLQIDTDEKIRFGDSGVADLFQC